MNNSRRRKLNDAKNNISEAKDKLETAKYLIEDVRDDESDALFNIPDNFKMSDKYFGMEDAVSELDDISEDMETLIDRLGKFNKPGRKK